MRLAIACAIGVLAIATTAAGGNAPLRATRPERICYDPGGTFEQIIQGEFKQASVVFSGEVRELTLERATLAVIKSWKGKLTAEVIMLTGTTDNKDGTHTLVGESFPFTKGATYVLFAFGKTSDGVPVEPLTTSICQPNVLLSRAGPTIEVLDKIGRRAR